MSASRLLMVWAVIVGTAVPVQAGMAPEWVEKWSEDLVVAHTALIEKHPSPFDHVSPEALDAEFDDLTRRLPGLDHTQVIIELARIVALIEDGHTRLTLPLAPGVDFPQGHSETEPPALPEMQFHQFPLRLAIDAASVWVEQVEPPNERLLGGRLVAIDGMPVDEALERLRPTIRADNEMQVLYHLPMHLVLVELLQARGISNSPERAAFTIERTDGSSETVPLARVSGGTRIEWAEAGRDRTESIRVEALSRLRTDENFWFTRIDQPDLVYVQFNTVYDTPEETIRQFAERLSQELGERPEAALVIDLRRNRGGNQSLGLPLLHAVIASPQNRAGRLFTLIGRATFSAAMTFALELERHTQTLFVGEPTGSKPNHYGDSRKTVLPNSNITLRISSLYWQWSPNDHRPWIAPHIEAPPSRVAVLAGVDPAMVEIVSVLDAAVPPGETKIDGVWLGNLPPASYGRDSVLRLGVTDGGLVGRVDIPPFGLEDAPIDDLAIDSGRISFGVTIGDETIRYEGRMTGPWIVGHGDLGSVRFPFLLKRSGEGM